MPRYKVDCFYCDEGDSPDCDCGDDTCCCAEPTPRPCSECRGRGFLIVTKLTDDNCESAVELREGGIP